MNFKPLTYYTTGSAIVSIPVNELVERYKRLSSPVVYDILDTMGYPNQALSADIRTLDPQMVVAGPAFTIDGYSF